MSSNVPVAALVVLGVILAVLGLLVGGSIELTVIGLVAIAVGGLIAVLGARRTGA
jgi:hypothetical protein